jgi:VWFA-related protein
MKRSLLFVLGPFVVITGLILPAQAEKRISVAQLEQSVAELKSVPDADAARRLSDLQLSERLSPQRFTALTQAMPGEKSRQALLAIADQSEFLNPPSSEIPPNPTPPVPEQRRIMGLVATYVKNSIPQLPNFFATRTTDHFEDTPQLQRAAEFFIPHEPLHFLTRSRASVFYQNGREVVDTKGNSGKPKTSNQGLTTWGVFGPILGSVLVDAATSKLAWSHWEQGATGPVAVFDFQVPQQKSHYEVNYCCYVTQASTAVADVHPFRRIVPYRGSMTVDPSTGVILRLVVEAELKPADPVTIASILVDYGPIEIGGETYTCPLRSLSSTVAQTVQLDPVYKYPLANQIQPLKTSLNDVSFGNYHMFRSEMRVLSPEEADLVQQAQATTPALLPAAEEHASAKPAEPTPTPSESKPEPPPEHVAAVSAPAPPAVAPEEPATPEITTAAASTLPDIPAASAPSTPDTGYRLRTTTRLVEVTVVAFDKKGHPVTDLKPADFEIYDNARKQTVNLLTQAVAESVSQPASNSSTEQTFTNRPVETSSAPVASPQRVSAYTTIFLIDSSHVAFADLTYARSEMLRFLKSVPADEPVALYALRKYGFQVLREPTTDHEQLAVTLRNWMPSAQDLFQSQQEEMRNRQHMEYVRSSFDMQAMNGKTPTGSDDYQSAPDIQRRSLGDTPEQNALQYLIWVARHVAAFKGHKSLIWVASDNVLADFSEKAPQNEKGDKYLDPLSLKAREALNEAQVSIYPLDSSQLEPSVVGANLQHGNVQVNPVAPAAQQIGTSSITPQDTQNREDLQAMEQARRDINPGRLTAQMQQDTHPIQGTFRELAAATGGRALRRASDIAAELESIVNDGRAAYTLSFTPDTPADGAYHHLTVKLATRRDITLRYRTGYLYEKEPATLKERFQNAVWRPADFSEIALSATPSTSSSPAAVKLNVAATDLALAQQAGFWMDKLDIFLVQRDDALFHAKIDGQTLGLRLKPSSYEKVLRDGINIDEPVKNLPGSGALRIVVIDENTGRIGTLTLPATSLVKKP